MRAPGARSGEPFRTNWQAARYGYPASNVYAKVSNHVMHSRAPYPWRDLHDYQRRVIDSFGPQRLMWGSNWPMDTAKVGYVEWLDALRLHFPFLTVEERAMILGRTALRLWPRAGG